MATSARKENRYRRNIWAANNAADARKREFEAAFMSRGPRPVVVPPKPKATRRQVRSWMRRNAADYDGATQLAEGTSAALDLPVGAMDDETHWVWEEAISAIEWAAA